MTLDRYTHFVARPDWLQIAARAWEILVDHAQRRRQLYYSELAEPLGIHHRNVRHALELLQEHCLQTGKPNLTVLVISKSTQRPGAGFAGASSGVFQRTVREVLDWPWNTEPNPYGFALDGATERALISGLLAGGEDAVHVADKVSDRGPLQALFRAALLEAYQERCAFSGSNMVEALDAAHIVPWSEASNEERTDIGNGLLLSAYHHRLYDRGILILHEDLRVSLAPEVDSTDLVNFDREAIRVAVADRMKFPPKLFRHFPRKDLIRRRNQEKV